MQFCFSVAQKLSLTCDLSERKRHTGTPTALKIKGFELKDSRVVHSNVAVFSWKQITFSSRWVKIVSMGWTRVSKYQKLSKVTSAHNEKLFICKQCYSKHDFCGGQISKWFTQWDSSSNYHLWSRLNITSCALVFLFAFSSLIKSIQWHTLHPKLFLCSSAKLEFTKTIR